MLQVRQRFLYPCIAPHSGESKAAECRRLGHRGPLARAARNHAHGWFLLLHGITQRAQKSRAVCIPIFSELVCFPLTRFALVIQIQHRLHRADAQTVCVELRNPEHRRGQQERLHFAAPEIKLLYAVHHILRVGFACFIARLSVKHEQSMRIGRESGSRPIQNDTDTRLMTAIHQIHQVMRRTVPAGCGEKAQRLISPRAVIRMLQKRQQFQMGIPHLAQIRNQSICNDAIIKKRTVFRCLPRPKMYFINIHRFRCNLSALHPVSIAPYIPVHRIIARCICRPHFCIESKRIRFIKNLTALCPNAVFIAIVAFDVCQEAAPEFRILRHAGHRCQITRPAAFLMNHGDIRSMRRPNAELYAFLPVLHGTMRTQPFPRALFGSVVKCLQTALQLLIFIRFHWCHLPSQNHSSNTRIHEKVFPICRRFPIFSQPR